MERPAAERCVQCENADTQPSRQLRNPRGMEESVAAGTVLPDPRQTDPLPLDPSSAVSKCLPTGADAKTSVIVISLTVHFCVLCFLASRATFGVLLAGLPFPSGQLRPSLTSLHTRHPWMLPKIFTEQLVTWILIVMAVVDLVREGLITHPFVPKPGRDINLTRAVFCINIGKYIYKSFQDMLVVRHLTRFKVDFLHHCVTLCCYAVFLTHGENLLLGLVGILMESDLLCNEVIRVQKQVSCDKNNKSYKRLVVVSALWTVLSRAILPFVFLILAVVNQEVMSMQFVTVIFWFLAMVFFLAISVWLILKTGIRVRKTLLGHPLPVNITDLDDTPPVVERCQQGETTPVPVSHHMRPPSFPERTIPLQYKNDLSYLSPYSNVNINTSDRNSKLNLFNKKVMSKATVNNISVLFKANPLEAADRRGLGLGRDNVAAAGTSSSSLRTVANTDEHNRSTPILEPAVETRVDESRAGVPRVVISGPDHPPRPGVHRAARKSAPQHAYSRRV